MKEYIEVIPLEGICYKGEKICFGDSKETVRNKMNVAGSEQENAIYFFDSELRFDFDVHNRVEFIEFLGEIDGEIQPQIYGVPVFETLAEKFVQIIEQNNGGPMIDEENGYSYAFLNSEVGVYREAIVHDVEEMIEESANDGNIMSEEEVEYEYKKAKYWNTFGIGRRGYYGAMLSM